MAKKIRTITVTIIIYSILLISTTIFGGKTGLYNFVNIVAPLLTSASFIILGSLYMLGYFDTFDKKENAN